MKTWRLIGLSLLLGTTWLGCSDDSEPTPDAGTAADAGTDPVDSGTDGGSSGGDAGTDAGPTDNSVRVRRFTRYLTATGFDERPSDFAQNPVELFIEDGDTLVPITGMAGGPGEYVFPNVPRVTYYLKTGTTYVVTDSRNVDLSTNLLGRADAVALGTDSTASVALNGLEAWYQPAATRREDPDSELALIAEQVGYSARYDPRVENGATSVNEEDAFLLGETGNTPRFEAEKGDRAWVVQLNPRQFGTLSDGGTQRYRTAVRATQLPAFSHDGGQPLRIEGTLQPLTLNELPLDWRISSFAEHAAEVNPAATARSSSFALNPTAYQQAEWVGYSGELLRLERPLDDTSNAMGTLVYGNPYPSSWGMLATASTSFSMLVPIPGEEPFRVSASSYLSGRPSAIAASPVVPRIRPPRNFTLDGTEAYTARTLTPGAHVIAWQPPSSGVPDAYLVRLQRINRIEGSSFRFLVTAGGIYLDGSATSARLPAGLLQPGQHYFLIVRAIQADGYSVSDKPLTLGDRIVTSEAGALSGLLTVPAQAP
jgi:hypothetical protein